MGSILEDLALKLSDVVGIKVNFPLPDDRNLVMKIHARLFLLYDDDWALNTASLSCKRVQRLLNVVGIGHLCPKPADVTDPRRLPRMWSAFVSKIEEKYGSSGLYPRLRKVLKKQQILEARREADRARHHGPAADANPAPPLPPRQEASFSSQESETGFRFARPLARGRHISSSSTVSSTASQSPSKPRSKIPVLAKPNVIPTGRQLMRTPCGPKADVAPPPPGPASPPVPARRICASPATTKPATAPPEGRTPASARKPQTKRLSQLVVDRSRCSGAGNISYELVVVAPVRRSVDESPVKPAESPADAGVEGVAPSPLSKAASPERRKSLVPVAVSPEQMLGQYIEDQLNTRFPDQELPAEAQGELVLPPQQKGRQDGPLNATFTPEKNMPAPQVVGSEGASLNASGDKENIHPGLSLNKDEDEGADFDGALQKDNGRVEENGGAESKSTSGRRSTFDISPASRTNAAPDVEDAPVLNPGLAAGEVHGGCAPAPVDPSLTAPSPAAASVATTVDAKSAPEEDAAGPPCDGLSQARSVKAKAAAEKVPAKRRGRAKKTSATTSPVDIADSPKTEQSSKGVESNKTTQESLEVTEVHGPTTDVADAKLKRNRGKKTVARRTASGRSQTEVPEQKLAAETEAAVTEEPLVPKTTKSETESAESKTEAAPVEACAKKKTARRRGRAQKEVTEPEPCESVSCDVTTALPTAGSQTGPTLEAECPAPERAVHETPVDGAEKAKVAAPKRKAPRERKKEAGADASTKYVDVELSSRPSDEGQNEVDSTIEAVSASVDGRETEKELPRRKPSRGKKKRDDTAVAPADSMEEESNELAQVEKENVAAPKRKSAHPRKARSKKGHALAETSEEKPVQTKPDNYDSEGELSDTVEATTVRRRPARGRKQREAAGSDAAEHGSPACGMALRLRSELSTRSSAAGGASPARPRRAAAKKAAEALHVPESPLPEPRLRRLRVAHDSDSTPPEPTPPRRAAKPSARPRRALRAVENCD